MNAASSFLGKCLTVLLALGLSWVTVTRPEIDTLASKICGVHNSHPLDAQQEPLTAISGDFPDGIPSIDVAMDTGETTVADSPVIQPSMLTPVSVPELTGVIGAAAANRTGPSVATDTAQIRSPSEPSFYGSGVQQASWAEPVSGQDAVAASQPSIEQISAELRELGCSYLLLEKLTDPSGSQFRVRCDVAGEGSATKCCFEVTRNTAEAAMTEVLRVARQNAGNDNVDHRFSPRDDSAPLGGDGAVATQG